jgi:hypothetical protein
MDKFRFDFNDPNLKYNQTHFEKNLYFITMHFQPNLFSARDAKSLYNSRPMFESFRLWYLDAVRTVMGPRAGNKLKYQPFGVACLDVEGTAHGATASVFQIPHIHACLLVHPKNQDEFETHLLSLKAKQFRDQIISKIDIRQFQDDTRGIWPCLKPILLLMLRIIRFTRNKSILRKSPGFVMFNSQLLHTTWC